MEPALPSDRDGELRAAAGLNLSEFEARLPSMICGLVALVVFPRMFSGRVERFPVELLGWLVALSPAFVLHSRMALPFMPMALLVFAALMVLERRASVVVGVLSVLAVVAAPFFARIDIPLETVGAVLRLLALAGLVLLLRKNLRLGLYTLAAAAGYVAGVLLIVPWGLDDPIVLNRWLLPVLPFVFLWVAMAIGRPWIPRSGLLGQGLQRSAARFFILFLFWTGPFLTKASARARSCTTTRRWRRCGAWTVSGRPRREGARYQGGGGLRAWRGAHRQPCGCSAPLGG